jgi:hypothetical protein
MRAYLSKESKRAWESLPGETDLFIKGSMSMMISMERAP